MIKVTASRWHEWSAGAEDLLEVRYAYFPEGSARRQGVRVPVVRDHTFIGVLLGVGGLAVDAATAERHARRIALARLIER